MTESQRHLAVTAADVAMAARAIAEEHTDCDPDMPCEACRESADAVLSALAAAGRLLPAHAETEYGVQWHGLDVVPVDAERAMSTERRFQNAVAVRRAVGPWQPIPPSEGENP